MAPLVLMQGFSSPAAPLPPPVPAGGAGFPLAISGFLHDFVTAQNVPFLMHGDAAWSLMVQPSDAQVETYLSDRATKGFNTVLASVIEHKFCDNPPNNFYGVGPFTTPDDFATPNETYFARVAAIIASARSRNICMLLNPAYLGVGGGSPTEGWEAVMAANGQTKLTNYGTYLANRFAAYNNIIWLNGTDSSNVTLSGYVATAIKAAQPKWLHTFQGNSETVGRTLAGAQSWFNYNNVYSYASFASLSATEYAASPNKPVLLVESRYENETGGTALLVRRQGYESIMSGACGYIYGNFPVWKFGAESGGWASHLNDAGGASLTYLKTLLDSL